MPARRPTARAAARALSPLLLLLLLLSPAPAAAADAAPVALADAAPVAPADAVRVAPADAAPVAPADAPVALADATPSAPVDAAPSAPVDAAPVTPADAAPVAPADAAPAAPADAAPTAPAAAAAAAAPADAAPADADAVAAPPPAAAPPKQPAAPPRRAAAAAAAARRANDPSDSVSVFKVARTSAGRPSPEAIKAAVRDARELSFSLTPEQASALREGAARASERARAASDGGASLEEEPAVATYAPRGGGAVPMGQGTGGLSFADSRLGKSASAWTPFVQPAGKLLFRVDGASYMCSASLIGKSVIVTAAHCVAAYGKNKVYSDFVFIPGFTPDHKPDTVFMGDRVAVPNVYLNGTDACLPEAQGVVCSNDVAVISLQLSTDGKQAFVKAGGRYYNYLANAFDASRAPISGFITDFVPPYLAITQLGYPIHFDYGNEMQMSNSPGFRMRQWYPGPDGRLRALKNIARGTAMTGGSSGGPWLINMGVDAVLGGPATYGDVSIRNAIVGVTSWGFTDLSIKIQGASEFASNSAFPAAKYGNYGAGNIGALMFIACENWGLRAAGKCR
ncbi:hypothetical protein Rsub_13144 [Raphidocelis subcapitata]|uniref:Peptidase S1 domain-containing protein n=1 Tax=Raphidocelis subcapitata TaxID=307507 RepID=A0A2V0PL02_9CHLO|nr:hypothetical protein Rsub_13144 [Raphidocelis subcapitata]|eukprot:GBG00230.1 hypothetical protein Rsub_13144 [Raphidocelis subcapitata]